LIAAAESLLAAARKGDTRSIARLLTIVENDEPGSADILRALYPETGRARIVGVTGPPGGGKSTLVSRLAAAYRSIYDRVAIVAVDPSSPFTGGAILGDRIRMQDHATDDGVFIRSMASRGRLGGLSAAVPQALRVLDAAGCDVVLVETVGVGQAEVEIASLADTTMVLLAPGMGDGIQAAKAGILEIADILVVNTADDQINPPELHIVESEIGKVKHARFVLLPITSQTRGHGTHTLPIVWGKYLAQLLSGTAH